MPIEHEAKVLDIDPEAVAARILSRGGKQADEPKLMRRYGARLEVDEWPRIPPYLEIEADSRDDVVRVANLLGYDERQLTGENTVKVYARYGIKLASIKELRF